MNKSANKFVVTAMSGLLLATVADASQVKESEEHSVRALRDKTGLITDLNKLALEKSSSAAVKTLIARMTDEYTLTSKQIVEIAAKLEISGVGGNLGAPPNGVTGGATGGAPNAAGMGAAPAGAAPTGAGGSPPGAAPGGAATQGAPAAAGATVNRGTGPGPKNAAIVQSLQALSGEAFDQAYLLNVLRAHEDIERNVLAEIIDTKANAKLAEWSKDFITRYARNASIVQSMLEGKSDGVPMTFAKSADEPNRKGPTVDQAQPGLLFGTTIGTKL
jgi:predicted outer membrane protein